MITLRIRVLLKMETVELTRDIKVKAWYQIKIEK